LIPAITLRVSTMRTTHEQAASNFTASRARKWPWVKRKTFLGLDKALSKAKSNPVPKQTDQEIKISSIADCL
jgi:hypothetical protein